MRKTLSLSAMIYAAGLASLLIADIVVTNRFTQDGIADWAVFRSLVGIAAILPLVGLDQVLVRSPQSSALLLRILAVQLPLVGTAVGVAMAASGFVSHWWIGAGLAIGSSLSLVLFQYFRSHHLRVLSQFAQQGWKIAALIAVFWISQSGVEANIFVVGVCLLLMIDIFGLVAVFRWPPQRMRDQSPEPIRAHYAIGLRFMVTALFLALSVHAEQLVVNRLGSTEEAALFFTTATYFLFPASFLNGYIAFLIAPWIRDNHDRFLAGLRRYRVAIGGGIFVYGLILSGVSRLGWTLTAPAVGGLDNTLQAFFTLSAIARTTYVIPSGYIGVFGHRRQHDVLIALQIAALGIALALFLLLWKSGTAVVYAVALASAFNWVMRSGLSYGVMNMIARSYGGTDDRQ